MFSSVAEQDRDPDTVKTIYGILQWFESEKKDKEVHQSGEKNSKV